MKYIVKIIAIASICWSCASQSHKNGIWTYDGISPTTEYSYALPKNAPIRVKKHLKIALAYWNDQLGTTRLRWTNSAAPSVKVSYTEVSNISTVESYASLIGCLDGFKRIFDCEIKIEVPNADVIMKLLPKYMHLYKKGPFDRILVENFSYEEDGTLFFQDKIVLMSLVHEIGHTLGLGHADDDSCVMAPAPEGHVGLCIEELAAARGLLDLSGSAYR